MRAPREDDSALGVVAACIKPYRCIRMARFDEHMCVCVCVMWHTRGVVCMSELAARVKSRQLECINPPSLRRGAREHWQGGRRPIILPSKISFAHACVRACVCSSVACVRACGSVGRRRRAKARVRIIMFAPRSEAARQRRMRRADNARLCTQSGYGGKMSVRVCSAVGQEEYRRTVAHQRDGHNNGFGVHPSVSWRGMRFACANMARRWVLGADYEQWHV